ncbi:Root cap [Macleaya cordata]|uniref:Root cap n=1 Tax=Macleaya cordata TaxID=56857 RepID=A0A200Q682_MACCD|nr:Root cap [Macleaya cordata]
MAVLMKMNFLLRLWALCLLTIVWLTVSVESGPLMIKRHKVRCTLIQYIRCYLLWQFCPLECPTSCMMDCATCKPVCSCNYPGAVCQDPRFVGRDGVTFYFHGKKDRDFCLVSDSNLHINAHFIGKRNPKMKRDFTWVQSIGVLFDDHQLLVGAKKTSNWDDNVDHLELVFDGKLIFLPHNEGAKWLSPVVPHVMLTRTTNTNSVTVEVAGNFKVTALVVPITPEESRVHGYNITDENCFAHLELSFKFYKLTDNIDGVLGQTYRSNYVSKVKMGVTMPVMGGHHKYSSSHLFATDCAVSRFSGNSLLGAGAGEAAEYASLKCNNGINGNGVACKK